MENLDMAMPHSLENKDTQEGELNDTNFKGTRK